MSRGAAGERVGAAVIGTGFIGGVHVETLRRIGVDVRGVLGSTPDRGAAAAERLGVARAYASLEELVGDPRVDVVHVTSPNDRHLPDVLAALEAGKHVVCEKPLTLTAAEAAILVERAAASDRVTAVNFHNRFYPLNQQARTMVAAGDIGEVRLVTGRYHQDWLLFESDWNWRLDPARGGLLRAVGDIGSHWLDLVGFVTWHRVSAVMADLATFLPTRLEPTGPVETFSARRDATGTPRAIATEDVATILLRFEGGARGVLSLSQVSPGRRNSLQYEVDGSDAAIAWDVEDPDRLWIGHRDRANELLQRDPTLLGAPARLASILPAGHVEGFADAFGATFRAVYADVDAGTRSPASTYASFADGYAQMVLGEAIQLSAREGNWVDVAG